MEFGFFVQGYVPDYIREVNPNAEHQVLMDDLEVCIAADKAGFKYIWVSEHHFLDQYSHLSANDVFLGALSRTTTRAHLGSGIFNPLPKVSHPAAVAERVAMLDHLTEGRFEFGTGRGSGSVEVTGFHTELADASGTREIWEDVIAEFPKMWMQDTYEGYSGKFWDMPPRKILPKPFKAPHPPMWYACGNHSSFELTARKGLGVLGFSLSELAPTEKAIQVYKNNIANAEPVGAFVNDSVLVATFSTFVDEDREQARHDFLNSRSEYLLSLSMHFHDQIPNPDNIPTWPNIAPAPDEATLDSLVSSGGALVGDPDDVLEQFRRWESTGADVVLIGGPTKTKEQNLKMIELLGKHVIPKLDTEPRHHTDILRERASS